MLWRDEILFEFARQSLLQHCKMAGAIFLLTPRQSQCYNHQGNENIDLLTYEQKGGQL
jgi:hypothetical protein